MKILVLLDGSKFSEEILGPVKKLISSEGDNEAVHLVHVLDQRIDRSTWAPAPAITKEVSGILSTHGSLYSRSDLGQRVAVETKNQASDRHHDEALDYLQHISATHFNNMAHIEVIFSKDKIEAIARYAESEKFDFVAMATHGRTGLLGSMARSLLKANVPPLYLVQPGKLDVKSEPANAMARS